MCSKSCGDKEWRNMIIQTMVDENEPQIITNSFYDVFYKQYTDEELDEYKRLIGMPMASSYEELISCLK